jgi:hypothetical protein
MSPPRSPTIPTKNKKQNRPWMHFPTELGHPNSVAMDNGYFSASNIETSEQRGIKPYIATGR